MGLCTYYSPLQYQKQLRLLKAHHLIAENFDAARATYQFGYKVPPNSDANISVCLVLHQLEILKACV